MRLIPAALASCALCALLALPSGAEERPGGAGDERGGRPPAAQPDGRPVPDAGRGRADIPARVDASARFTIRERDLFRSWHAAEYGRGKCAPGLVKKTTVCLPPGRKDKRYAIGMRLPGAVVPAPLPLDLARRVGTPPIGYRYAIVDGDLLKLAVDTMLVVDAINGLSPP